MNKELLKFIPINCLFGIITFGVVCFSLFTNCNWYQIIPIAFLAYAFDVLNSSRLDYLEHKIKKLENKK